MAAVPRVVFSRANFDLMTSYLSAYTTKLIAFAKEQGYEVIDLYGDDPKKPCRLLQFEAEIEQKPTILIGAGHGAANLFTGQDLEVLLKQNVNDELITDIKTYIWSCQTALGLGPSAIGKGCPEYYGYTADWTVIINPDFENNPLEDPWAKAFFDCGLATGYAVLLGKTPKEVYELTLERYDFWWDWWLKQNSWVTDDIVTWLNWDRSAFTALTSDGIYKRVPSTPNMAKLLLPIAGAGLLFFLLK